MPTLAFATGFEHQVAAIGASATGGELLWDTVLGAVVISTTTVRTGLASLRVNPSASLAYVQRTAATGQRIVVGVAYARFASLPTATDCEIVSASVSVSWCRIGVRVSDGQWFAQAASGTVQVGGTPTTGIWYRIDYKIDTSANPWKIDWQIDGSAKTQATGSVAAGDLTNVRLGAGASATVDMFLDDVAYGFTSGDYPIGGIHINGHFPEADGTHSNPSNFQDAANNAIVQGGNPAWDQMDVAPLSSLTEYVTQTADGATDYVEVAFTNSAESTAPVHVQVSIAISADATQACNATYRIRDGATDSDIFSGDPSQTSDIFRTKGFATKPSSGAWTDAAFDALLFRFGFSSDATPDPRCGGVIAEAVFAEPANTTTTKTQTGKANVRATTARTQPGKADIRATTTKTQTGTGRVRKTASATQAGVSRVQVTAPQVQTGRANLQATTPRTQSGTGRIQKTAVPATQTGKATINKTVAQAQTGKADITATTPRTQLGKADIRAAATRTQPGMGRIRVTASTQQTGTARIRQTTSAIQTGKSRMTATVSETQQGVARVRATTPRSQSGRSAVQNTTSRTQAGVAKISGASQQAQLGKADIRKTAIATQSGTARVRKTASAIQDGIARLRVTAAQQQTGKSRVEAIVARTQAGKARMQATASAGQTGRAALQATATRTQAGIGRIQATGITQVQTGTATILLRHTVYQLGVARLLPGGPVIRGSIALKGEKGSCHLQGQQGSIDLQGQQISLGLEGQVVN